jgi:TonB family protein
MSFSWKQYEGQTVNNAFPLQRYLGGSSESAVFLTQLAGPQSSKAVIKLVPEGASADMQLSLWRRASKLTHPNLLQLYQGGRCRIADMDLLYVVMEYAEEDLSQILPQRALTPAEARDMLGPVLDALRDLHAQGLVHSRLKPSNILATADQVKLSTDRLFPAGELRKSSARRTAYDAPETPNQALTAASDVWSLGVLLIEVLNQRAPDSQGGESLLLAADSLAQPFREIARHALEPDPRLRGTIAHIEASLNPRAAAAAQSASSAPAVPGPKLQAPRPALAPPVVPTIGRAPLAPIAQTPKPAAPIQPLVPPLVSPISATKEPAPPAARKPAPPSFALPPIAAVSAQKHGPKPPKQPIVLPSYVIPIAVGLVVVASMIALPKILSRGVGSSSSASTNAAARVAPQSGDEPADARPSSSGKPKASSPKRESSRDSANSSKEVSHASAASPSPTPLRTETKAAPDATKSAAASAPASAKGEVLDQILPDVPEKSLITISGKVRVILRAHVDPAGNVSSADFESPGPSKYFADAAQKALRRWEFTPPEVSARSVASEWLVRFEFTASGIKAFPTQVTP